MASFKVGDRVVIVRTVKVPGTKHACLGAVATVTELTERSPACDSRWPDDVPVGTRLYRLCIDGVGALNDRGHPYAAPDSWLEPLKDDGHEKAEWTDELRRLCQVGNVDA